MLILAVVATLLASLILTPIVRILAFRIGAVDRPNYRKVHTEIMPRIGGLAIYVSFMLGYLILRPTD